MSLYGMMRTGVSGMNAQASRLATVADNIANAGTTGYKRSRAEFSTLVIPQSGGAYTSSGVTTSIQTAISKQGVLQYTTSATDLAISGEGFFVVRDPNGSIFLTRAGSFVPDGEGRLVNAAGFQLMGYSYANGTPTVTANGFDGLSPITVAQSGLQASPSTSGKLTANLPREAEIVAPANLPSANDATATYSERTSLIVYDNLGGKKMLDVYITKTADNTWEVAAFDRAASTDGGFPYTSGPLATQTLNFDGTGNLGAALSLSIPVPGGQSVTLDLSSMSQLAGDFEIFEAETNGNPPSPITSIEIDTDGTVYAKYDDDSVRALYRIPLASVQSPDRLNVLAGNVFSQSTDSGQVRIGFATEGRFGRVDSGALESSTVDIAEELTNMIESQRSYTANSKVFQTGSELMDILVNLKR